MGFCQWFRYFNDRFKFTHVAEIKLSVLMFNKTDPNHKNSVYKAFDHKRYHGQWYEFVVSPSFWTNIVSMERKTSKIKSGTKKSTLLVKKSR